MDGGSMKNKASRAKIKSNAFKATKAFTKINDETIIPLIASLTSKIQPQLDIINAVKANQSVLKSGLQQIRKDVNADVDAFEAELQRIEDEKIEAERVAAVDRDYDFAKVLYNEYLSQLILGESILTDWQKLAIEKAEADRIKRENAIAEKAAEDAKLEAEAAAKEEADRIARENQAAIDAAEKAKADALQEAEAQKQAAIQAELELEQAEDRLINQQKEAEKQAKIADENRIAAEKQAKESAKRQADQAADQARIAEVSRQKAEQDKIEKQNAARLANQEHVRSVCTEVKESLMQESGLTEQQAVNVVKAIRAGKIAKIKMNF
jgi:hypothetical protein